MKQLAIYGLVICSAFLFIGADALSANWGKTGSVPSLILMVVIGSTGYLVFGILNSRLSLAVSGGLVNIILVIGALVVSTVYFNEVLSDRQMAGIGLACLAILLMNS